VTRYGAKRFAAGKGRSAGRDHTGAMIDSISSDVKSAKTEVVGHWGWIDEFKDYFGYQDWGTSRVPAAHSLLDSYVQARAKFISRVTALAGRSGR